MIRAQFETTGEQNVRVVRMEPDVKSRVSFKLLNAGVSGNTKTGKSADPICYHAPVSQTTDPAVDAAGLFENQIRRDR